MAAPAEVPPTTPPSRYNRPIASASRVPARTCVMRAWTPPLNQTPVAPSSSSAASGESASARVGISTRTSAPSDRSPSARLCPASTGEALASGTATIRASPGPPASSTNRLIRAGGREPPPTMNRCPRAVCCATASPDAAVEAPTARAARPRRVVARLLCMIMAFRPERCGAVPSPPYASTIQPSRRFTIRSP